MTSKIDVHHWLYHCSCAHSTGYLIRTMQQFIRRDNVESVLDYGNQ